MGEEYRHRTFWVNTEASDSASLVSHTWSPRAERCHFRDDVLPKIRESLCNDVYAKGAAASIKKDLATQYGGCSSKYFAEVEMANVDDILHNAGSLHLKPPVEIGEGMCPNGAGD